MFISFARTLKRMGGLRLGVGIRITRKNAWYIIFWFFLYAMFMLMWWLIIGVGWMAYWVFYGLFKVYSWIFKGCVSAVKKIASNFTKNKAEVQNDKVSSFETQE